MARLYIPNLSRRKIAERMKAIFQIIPESSGAAKCSFALRKALITERTVWREMTGSIMIKSIVVICFASGVKPGAIMFIIPWLKARKKRDKETVIMTARLINVE